MIKKVKLDQNGALTEIDWKAARRVAAALRDYILNAPKDEAARHSYLEKALPLANSVLDGTVDFPFSYTNSPYNMRLEIEGLVPSRPEEFAELFAELLYHISGSVGSCSLRTHETGEHILFRDRETDEDGNIYELCWFED